MASVFGISTMSFTFSKSSAFSMLMTLSVCAFLPPGKFQSEPDLVNVRLSEPRWISILSILSGSHRELIPAVLDALSAAGVSEIPVVVGGIIPEADAETLRESGVAAVYTPKDWDLNQMMRDIVALVAERNGIAAAA